jgi:hypothetical protein
MAGAVGGHALLQRRPALVVLVAAEVGVGPVRVLRVVAASVRRLPPAPIVVLVSGATSATIRPEKLISVFSFLEQL